MEIRPLYKWLISLFLWILKKLKYNTEEIEIKINPVYYDIKTFTATVLVKNYFPDITNQIRAKYNVIELLLHNEDLLSLISFEENTMVNGDKELTAILIIGVKRK